MKDAKRLGFDGRYTRLAPAISQTFDLALMTRIAIGPGWAQIPADQQQRLNAAFSRYTISMYANRFDDFGGERFEVTPAATPEPERRPGQQPADQDQRRGGRAELPAEAGCRRRLEGHRRVPERHGQRTGGPALGIRRRYCSATAPRAWCS